MTHLTLTSWFLTLCVLTSSALAQAPACSDALCKAKRKKIDTVCHTVGGLVYFEKNDGSMCYCKCSCVEGRTLVAVTSNQMTEIHGIKVGGDVMALQPDGTWEQKEVTYSDGTTFFNKPVYFAIYVLLENGTDLIVTPDHLFLTEKKKLIRADRLQPETRLLRSDLTPVAIKRAVPGKFSGSFHNVAVGEWDNENFSTDGHFINTKGIVSADFYLQSTAKGNVDINLKLPQIGTPEYREKNISLLRGDSSYGLKSAKDIKVHSDESFTPYRAVNIPANAQNYLPKEYETPALNMLAPLDASVPYEVAEYLKLNYENKFPDIEMHIDWTDNNVNAYAWMDGGKRHVALLGGLLRHKHVKVEGAGLVLAHEIGHHYGGKPRYGSGNTWASCEGQSDYWGAMVAQRHVWWGPYAIEQIEKGSDQLYNLFAYGLKTGSLFEKPVPATGSGCSHPSAACRLATYKAAITLDDKPACAGAPPENQ